MLRHRVRPAWFVAVLCVVVGCSGTTTSTPTSLPAPVRRVVTAGTFVSLALLSRPITLTTTSSGQLDITVGWTFPSDTIWIDLAPSTCTLALYTTNGCMLLISDHTTVVAPRKTHSVLALPAGSYVLWIDNLGPADESVSFEIDLTS